MSNQNFYRKPKSKSSTTEDKFQIQKVLLPNEMLLLELEKSSQDKKASNTIKHSEAMSMLRKKHL